MVEKLNSFTNAVGLHKRHELRVDRLIGTRYNFNTGEQDEVDEAVGYHNTLVEMSEKDPTVKGNHKDPTWYHRRVWKVTQDDPVITHLEYDNPVDHKTANYKLDKSTYISTAHGPFGYNPLGSVSELQENSRAEADVKALNKLAEVHAGFGEALATARQTGDMFADAAYRGARMLLALKRGIWKQIPAAMGYNKRNIGAATKQAANDWLQFQYGWKPLAQTIRDAEVLALQHLQKDHILYGNAVSKYESDWSFPYRDENWDVKVSGSMSTVLQAKISNTTFHQLREGGLLNPASIAWELVPWSFALDWFVPVGATLEAMTAGVGLDFVRGWRSEQNSYELNARNNTGDRGNGNFVTHEGHYQEKGFDFGRAAFNGFPPARFFADTTPFSTARVLNATALVRQLFK